MGDEELQEWGRVEFYTRLKQLETRTPEGLRAAQEQAKARAKEAGLSASQAASAVMDARRQWRNEQPPEKEAKHG